MNGTLFTAAQEISTEEVVDDVKEEEDGDEDTAEETTNKDAAGVYISLDIHIFAPPPMREITFSS